MAVHRPTTVWMLNKENKAGRNGVVRTADESHVKISYWNVVEGDTVHSSLVIPRADAKLLAQKIEECLIATAK